MFLANNGSAIDWLGESSYIVNYMIVEYINA